MTEQPADRAVEPAAVRIDVGVDGPYQVTGGVPLRRTRPALTDRGEPVGWHQGDRIDTDDTYWLCRCGSSQHKPFCDGSHRAVGFDGAETAPTGSAIDRATPFPVAAHPAGAVTVLDDRALCEHAGFCGNKLTNVWKMTRIADETTGAELTAMIERCPSGALSYSVEGSPVERELPVEVGVVDDGPLRVTGRVEVHRADGQPFETRNRVTLCRCGRSASKPLCDGSHAKAGFVDHA